MHNVDNGFLDRRIIANGENKNKIRFVVAKYNATKYFTLIQKTNRFYMDNLAYITTPIQKREEM